MATCSMLFGTVVLLFSAVSAFDYIPSGPCKPPLDMGTTPCNLSSSLRFHMDPRTLLCMAFEYTGCGGNTNNFESRHECHIRCLPMDYITCPVRSKPLPKPKRCHNDEECGPKGYCIGFKARFCCDKSIRDEVNSDYNPKCPAGKKVYEIPEGGIDRVLIGKNCQSKFCPSGATCVEGKYFATCCV